MRSIGDARWLNDYIGLPHKPGGRGPDAYDCYGLAKKVYLEQYDIELPDWHPDNFTAKGKDEAIASALHSGTWTLVEEPQDGDFVICSGTRLAHHIGLFFAGGVLHSDTGGSVWEPLSRFVTNYANVEFGEWTP